MIKPRKKYGESEDDFIVRASKAYYSNGYHITEIASKLNCKVIDVYSAVIGGKFRPTTEEERDVMILMYNQGMNYTEIAKKMNRSRTCVMSRIKKPASCNVESGYDLSDKDIIKMKEWYKSGKTVRWIAKQFDVPERSITYRLKKSGDYKKEFSRTVPLTSKEKITIKKLYKQGKTVKEIADITGRHHNLIASHIKNSFK